MTKRYLQYSPLVVAIQASLMMSVNAYAENTDVPYAELEAITITAESSPYTTTSSNSATGLDLTADKTPQSTTTITKEFIEDKNLDNVSDVIKSTSGVSLHQLDGGKSTYYARGFEVHNYQVDGMNVPDEAIWSTSDHLASTAIYDKVDVVRGANGLMTGSGTPSASINLIRKHADSSIFSGEVSAEMNEHGSYGTTVDLGTGLTQSGNVRGRLIVDYTDGDTFIDRQEMQNKLIYGIIDADLTDNTMVSVGAKYNQNSQKATMWGGLPLFYKDGSRIDYDVSKNASVDWVDWAGEGKEYFGSFKHYFNDNLSFELKGSHSELETDSKLIYILDPTAQQLPPGFSLPPGYDTPGLDKTTGVGLGYQASKYSTDLKEDNIQANLSGKFNALGHEHQFNIGGSYEKYQRNAFAYSDQTLGRFINFIPNFNKWDGKLAEPIWLDTKTSLGTRTVKEMGFFASTQLQLTDPLSVVLGSRLSNYKLTDTSPYRAEDIDIDNIWTPYAGVTYEFAKNQSVYASYTEIFQPQNQRDINGKTLDPITGQSYEVGVKGSNNNDTLQAQFGVFYIKQDNLAQATGKMISNTTPPEAAYEGADGATSKGIDVELVGQLNPNWQARVGYTHFIAKDRNDKPVNTNIANNTFNAFTTYDFSNHVDGLTIGGGLDFIGSRYRNLQNPITKTTEKYDVDAVVVANLMANYQMNDNLSFQLNVDNLFDKKYISSISTFNQILYAEPRTITGKITYEW